MDLKISKVTDKVNNLDVKGQGCWSDCYTTVWLGNKSGGSGCRSELGWTPQTCWIW